MICPRCRVQLEEKEPMILGEYYIRTFICPDCGFAVEGKHKILADGKVVLRAKNVGR